MVSLITRPPVLGPAMGIMKEGHGGEGRLTMRSETRTRTLQEVADVASKFETRPDTAVVGWLGCGVRGWVDMPSVVPLEVIGREECGV